MGCCLLGIVVLQGVSQIVEPLEHHHIISLTQRLWSVANAYQTVVHGLTSLWQNCHVFANRVLEWLVVEEVGQNRSLTLAFDKSLRWWFVNWGLGQVININRHLRLFVDYVGTLLLKGINQFLWKIFKEFKFFHPYLLFFMYSWFKRKETSIIQWSGLNQNFTPVLILIHDVTGLNLNGIKLNIILLEILAANKLDLIELPWVFLQSCLSLFYHVFSVLRNCLLQFIDLSCHQVLQLFFLSSYRVLSNRSNLINLLIEFLNLLRVKLIQIW